MPSVSNGSLTELASEDPFRTMIEQAAAGIVSCDLTGKFTYVNNKFCELLGYKASELLRLSISEVTHPDFRGETERLVKNMLATGHSFVVDKQYIRKDGSPIWASTTSNALIDADGARKGITGLIVDISARKRTEQELTRISESSASQRRLYETALSNTPDLVCVFDLNGRFTYANEALLRLWGKTWDESIGKTCLELGYEPWHAAMHDREIRTVAATRRPLRGEVAFTGTTGHHLYDYILAPVFNPEGEVEAVTGTARDVTERHTAEKALKENEERFRTMANNIAQFAWIADNKGQIFWVNQRWQDEIGQTPEEMLKGETVVHPDHFERVRNNYHQHMSAGAAWEDTFPMRRRDGTYKWFLSRAVPIRDNEGKVSSWFGTNTDISQLKSVEEALRESKERLQAALRAAKAGTFRWDIRTNELDWDSALDSLFGFQSGKPARSLDQFVALVHPDDRAGVIAQCHRSATDGSDFEMEFRVVWPDRSIHWLYDKGKTMLEGGRPAYMTGACVEITERKHAEFQTYHQRDILEQIARGVSLEQILETLTARVEAIAGRDLIATVLLLEPDRLELSHIAGRRAPSEWVELMKDLKIGAAVGSCGTAAFSAERVIVDDISTSPLWKDYAFLALKSGLRACWSTPILSSERKVLGTFAVYYREPGIPTPGEIQLVDLSASAAAIAIERKQSEEALYEARAKLVEHAQNLETRVAERTASLREAVSQMEEFSYTVSHDLRAPLRAMHVYSDALKEDFAEVLPEEAARYVEKISQNSRRLDKMILDVLTFSRLARSEVTMAEVNLDKFVRELVENYPGLRTSDVNIQIDRLQPVIGHEPSLTQVISNLLSNAVKFVARGMPPRVKVWTEVRGENIRLWVQDNGIGVPPAYQHRLFSMFERVHPDLPYDGTGVGLAIVRKAMERMNGAYGIESDGSHGSKFWVELKRGAVVP